MKPASDQAVTALAPVRAALLRTARGEAQGLLERADRETAALLDEARAQARSLVEEASRQGERDGAAAARAIRADARRAARARTLTVRREAYEELRRRAFARGRGLRDAETYPAARDRLRGRASRLLGPDAEITEAPDGGVVGRAAGRRAECTLDGLTARALDRLGAEAETLWSP
ncbi:MULTISPECIES: hypothetical protein [Streptomyces]|uniref:hypothetical protein n=1 Tax=Streptomyces TaxID=1883 RepID=UPI001B31CEAC|nr:hypothetical protein [Streptomyces sp. AgN23]QTI91088.1 hypothetical protein AS97_43830 [Streptomyces sp. AgN23]WTB09706.1 hypothetical protein OG546_39485 [Streptomyces antimycoticus]